MLFITLTVITSMLAPALCIHVVHAGLLFDHFALWKKHLLALGGDDLLSFFGMDWRYLVDFGPCCRSALGVVTTSQLSGSACSPLFLGVGVRLFCRCSLHDSRTFPGSVEVLSVSAESRHMVFLVPGLRPSSQSWPVL